MSVPSSMRSATFSRAVRCPVLAAPRHRVGPRFVEPDLVALDDLGEFGPQPLRTFDVFVTYVGNQDVKSRGGGFGEGHEDVAGGHLIARRDDDAEDHAVLVCLHDVFHLHRLDDDDGLTAPNRIAEFHVDGYDDAL